MVKVSVSSLPAENDLLKYVCKNYDKKNILAYT